MKKLVGLGAALLISFATTSQASIVSVNGSNGLFAGNSSADEATITALSNAQIASNLSDDSQATYVFGSSNGGTVNAQLDLSFAETVYNQAGNDLAFYFVGDGVTVNKTNSMQICFGTNCDLGTTTYDATIVDGLGITIADTSVEWSVALFDLSDFGFAEEAALGDFTIDLIAGGYNRLADIRSLNTVLTAPEPSPVPVPAAVWLFASGLLAMAGVARRKA